MELSGNTEYEHLQKHKRFYFPFIKRGISKIYLSFTKKIKENWVLYLVGGLKTPFPVVK